MEYKTILIPKFLQEIHGEKASLTDLALTYIGGLVSLMVVLVIYSQSGLSIEWWKLTLLLLISMDIGAGAIANFTYGTNLYYSGEEKRKTRIYFILAHFIHPAVYLYALDSFSLTSILVVLYIIGSTFFINHINSVEKQRIVAALLLLLGMSILIIAQINNPLLLWFFPLFMIKLLLAFGIRRYSKI